MTSTKIRACRACGGTTHGEPFAGGVITVCDKCGNCVVYGEDLAVSNPVSKAGVPERYRNVAPDYKSFERAQRTGRGFYLQGPNGTGKTKAASAVALAFIEKGKSVHFTSGGKLLSKLRDAMRSDESEAEVFAELTTPDLLVIVCAMCQYGHRQLSRNFPRGVKLRHNGRWKRVPVADSTFP